IEPLISELLSRFQDDDSFRMVVFEAGAVYPGLDDDNDDEEEAGAESEVVEEESAGKRSPARIAIEELEVRISSGAALNSTYVIMVLLSALVAAVGLLKDSTAVVIGAMVIAPLLGPNVALALGTTLGKLDLIKKALWTNVT